MHKDLTSKQAQILKFIADTLDVRGYPPSVREIGSAVGLRSSATVHAHLSKLEEKGYIRRARSKSRAIEILYTAGQGNKEDVGDDVISVPIVGQVTAGIPILAEENREGALNLSRSFVRSNNVFLLRVKGDSMVEAGILNGDFVLVRQQETADSGDIVVALLEDEATVKRFFREKDCIRLQPENPAYEPIKVLELSILGKVIGVFRRY